MRVTAEQKWLAFRAIHEDWGVPVDLIRQASGATEAYIAGLMERESWREYKTPRSLHARLIRIIHNEMRRLTDDDAEIGCEEKRARAFGVLAKTLESSVTTAAKLKTMEGDQQHNTKSDADASKLPMGSNDTLELDRKLEALVAGLAGEGTSKGSS